MLFALGVACEKRLEQIFQSRVGKCQILQIDEMYVGKRKYHRGRRPRHRPRWYMTIVEIDAISLKPSRVFCEVVPGPGSGYR